MTTASDKAAAVLRSGDVLAGKLRVERVLGAGGMGVVVAATHLHLNRLVAVKLVRPERADSPRVIQRFVREARAAVRLQSTHITRVLDAGELDDGTPYIVMELLEGRSLAELIDTRGRLPWAEACELVLQACVGVAEAHAHGIVHRDLKPANLFAITERGRPHVKVLDFGISKAPPDADWDLETTIEGATLGSPAYMSPEQMRSPHNVDARTDVWALGATLFHALAGAPPFRAESLPDLCVKVLHDATPTLPEDVEAPDGLHGVLARCLAKERSERYGSVAELAADLARYAPAHGTDSVAELEQLAAHAPSAPTTASDLTPPATNAPRSPSLPTTLAESRVLADVADGAANDTAAAPAGARPRRTIVWASAALATAAAAALIAATLRGEPSAPSQRAGAPAPAAPGPGPAALVEREPTPVDTSPEASTETAAGSEAPIAPAAAADEPPAGEALPPAQTAPAQTAPTPTARPRTKPAPAARPRTEPAPPASEAPAPVDAVASPPPSVAEPIDPADRRH